MSVTSHYAKRILAADIASKRGIPIEAADDIVEHVQDEINEYLFGEDSAYETIADIFTDYCIPCHLAWVFDCTAEIMDKL